MWDRSAAAALLLALSVGGCHGPSEPADAAPTDAVPEGCVERIGPYLRCGPDTDCTCPASAPCQPDLGVCWEPQVMAEFRPRSQHCAVLPESDALRYCWQGNQICAVPPDRDGSPTEFRGYCVERSYCDEAAARGLSIRCLWSDGSESERAPPEVASCPTSPAPYPLLPFCGGACGDCALRPVWGRDENPTACLGRSDTRGVGLCVDSATTPCYRVPRPAPEDRSASGICRTGHAWDNYHGATCVCVAMLRDGVPDDYGLVTVAETCLAYRELFPGVVECLNDGWHPLP